MSCSSEPRIPVVLPLLWTCYPLQVLAELQKAITAHAAREQAAEYSDDFESDKDNMRNGVGEELNESYSSDESTKKSVAVERPLSDDDASQKAADLENEAVDDLSLSFHEKKFQQITLLDRKDGEEECLKSQNGGDDRKNNEECSAGEEVQRDNNESDHCNDLPIHKLQEKRNQERKIPIPKPRVHKPGNASLPQCHTNCIDITQMNVLDGPAENVSIPSLDTCSRPTPRRRSMLKKSGPVEDRSERKITSRKEFSSVSASSSLTVKNAQATSKKNLLAKSPGAEKLSETKESVLQVRKASLSDRSLVSAHLKKKAKAVPSATPASSQHMGTLKVLEDKHVQKNSTEFNKADSLRAAVFQNWLEMKKHFLRESKRIEKEKAENLRNNIEKKEAIKREEAIASFEAWKRKKVREAKKLRQKKKLEELQKNETAEQNTDKSEAAQKAFEKWKEKKMEYLREQSRKEKQSDSRKKKKEEELVAQKKRDSMSAVEKWNEKKEEYIKQKKAEKIQQRRKQEIQQAKKEEKNKKAMEEYEKWLGKVVMREQLEKKQKKLQAVHGCEMPSPWNPPGKVAY
ncbi:uncharacterized protein AAGF69_003026 [Amazona ochrocephala]